MNCLEAPLTAGDGDGIQVEITYLFIRPFCDVFCIAVQRNRLMSLLGLKTRSTLLTTGNGNPSKEEWTDAMQRTFLASIDLCGVNGVRCADEFVKTDKRLISSRLLGKVHLVKSTKELDTVWREIENNKLQNDAFLKKQFDIKKQEIEKLFPPLASKTAASSSGSVKSEILPLDMMKTPTTTTCGKGDSPAKSLKATATDTTTTKMKTA